MVIVKYVLGDIKNWRPSSAIRNNLRKYDISVKSLESFHKTIKSLKNERQLKTLFDLKSSYNE
jgi:hypothetical protein